MTKKKDTVDKSSPKIPRKRSKNEKSEEVTGAAIEAPKLPPTQPVSGPEPEDQTPKSDFFKRSPEEEKAILDQNKQFKEALERTSKEIRKGDPSATIRLLDCLPVPKFP